MKRILFSIVMLAFVAVTTFAQEYWINENFTSTEWQTVMSTYVAIWNAKPENAAKQKTFPEGPANGNFAINDEVVSPDNITFKCSNCQYYFFPDTEERDGGANPGILPSIDEDITSQYLLRLNSEQDKDASLELPELENVKKITLHVRNRNDKLATAVNLDKYDSGTKKWTTVETKSMPQYTNFDGAGTKMTTIDYVLTYDFTSENPVKLRISKTKTENRYISIFKIKVEKIVEEEDEEDDGPNGPTSIQRTKNDVSVSISGKTLSVSGTTVYSDCSLFDLTGKEIFRLKDAGQQITLPESIQNGVYVLKLSGENVLPLTKKIHL